MPRKSLLLRLACSSGSASETLAAYRGALSAEEACASLISCTGHNLLCLLHQNGGPSGWQRPLPRAS